MIPSDVASRLQVSADAALRPVAQTQEIADKLVLSVRTVEKHRANIMDKTGVRDVASLTRYCIHYGLVHA